MNIPNARKKFNVTFSIDRNLFDKFDKYCYLNRLSKSQYICLLIEKDLEKKPVIKNETNS